MTTESQAAEQALPTILDEKAFRRPDFDEASVPIVMADGTPWYFPPVGTGPIRPVVKDGRCVDLEAGSGFGDAFDDALLELDKLTADAAIVVAADDEEMTEAVGTAEMRTGRMAEIFFAVAINLLRENYDLPDAAWSKIIRLNYASDTSLAMWGRIIAHARGRSIDALDDAAVVALVEGE